MIGNIDYASLVNELQNLRGSSAELGGISARQAAIKSRLNDMMQNSTNYTSNIQNAFETKRKREQELASESMSNGMANNNYSGTAQQAMYRGGGRVDDWISKALGILGMDNSYVPGIRQMIMHESGGNPNAINKWDSNWKAGHPSMGLMQTIAPTFNAWKIKGYDNIYDPVANIIAGVRYARNRYGDSMLKSGGRRNAAGNYIGY